MAKLKTSKQTLAAVMAVAALAEDNYQIEEAGCIEETGKALEIPDLKELVEKELTVVKDMEGVDLATYLKKACDGVAEGEEAYIFEAALQVILADGLISYVEASNLLIIADAMHFEHTYVLMMLADAMHDNGMIDVKFE